MTYSMHFFFQDVDWPLTQVLLSIALKARRVHIAELNLSVECDISVSLWS